MTIGCYYSSFEIIQINKQERMIQGIESVDHYINLFFVKSVAMVTFSLYLAVFLREDVQNIRKGKAFKFLIYLSFIFVIFAWLYFQSETYNYPQNYKNKHVKHKKSDVKRDWNIFSTLKVIIVATLDALLLNIFIVWKIVRIIDLPIG